MDNSYLTVKYYVYCNWLTTTTGVITNGSAKNHRSTTRSQLLSPLNSITYA